MGTRRIQFFDTTLRDGEQSPGICLGIEEKVEIALALARLKVDVIEAGFPAASPGDLAAVQAVAARVKGPAIAGLARANRQDIDRAWEGVRNAERPRIHTFIATSDIHLEHKLKMSRAEVLEATAAAVRYARSLTPDVEFSAEDASRSDWAFLTEVLGVAIREGASVVNVPDTVGYAMPDEFARLIAYVRQHTPGIEKAIISVHCHDDLGMAAANSIAAVMAGADQVECTINGLGERAGNAALEEIAMALATRREHFGVETGLDTRQIYRTSRIVQNLTGFTPPPNKAVIGDNAFAHESGIHQHGVLNNSLTYEIMIPESVGIQRNSLVLGKHSGRHAFEERLRSLGHEIAPELISELFARFKELADRKKTVFDRDIEALVGHKPVAVFEHYQLTGHHVVSGAQGPAMASVRLAAANGKAPIEQAAVGDGPVNALFNAIDAAVGFAVNLKDYQLKAVTSGQDALGEATAWVEFDRQVFVGRGLSTDVLEASARAYVNAINKMLAACGRPIETKIAAGGM
jgi:2-isopropylmalate synthase